MTSSEEKKKPSIPCTYRSLKNEIALMLFIQQNIDSAVKRWLKSHDKIIEVLYYGSREIERLPKRREEILWAIHKALGKMPSVCISLREAFRALSSAKHSAQEAQEE